jgi:hypothetical protein
VAAPAVGRVVNRIAPFLGVERKLPPATMVAQAGSKAAPAAPAALDPVEFEGTIEEAPAAPVAPLAGAAAQ